MARGREDPHFRRVEDEECDKSGLPIVSMDYQELNEQTESPQKLIIGKDEVSGNVFAHNVIAKGLTDEWACKKVVQDLEELGRSNIILKTDGEPAIKAVQNRIQAIRAGRTVPRNPPAYNPQSNGPCEKAVQDVTAQLRSLKIGLEYRLKIKIHDDAPIMQWMLEHAVFVLNKLNVHKGDGMTSYEKLTGRKWRRPLVEFGEIVLAKLALRRRQKGSAKKQKRKLNHRCIEGVWVGQVARTGEHIVVLDSGDAVRCRTVKRVPVADRWDAERTLLIKATPRCPAPNSKNPDKIESRIVDEAEAKTDKSNREVAREQSEHVAPDPIPREGNHDARDFRITTAILEKYGYTDECPGCVHKVCGFDHRPHTPACRQRLSEAMMKDAHDRDYVDAARGRKRVDDKGTVEERETEEVNIDEPNADVETMSIPELNSDIDIKDAHEHTALSKEKEAFDAEEDKDDAEQPEPDAKRPRIATAFNLQTMVAKDLAGIGDYQRDELLRCINTVNNLKSKGVVQEILEKLEEVPKFKFSNFRRAKKEFINEYSSMDVAEVYSPPRITEMARKLGMRPGWALDLTATDEDDGTHWDFSLEAKREKAKALVKQDRPTMLVMSPMCGPFSKLQEVFNYPKKDPLEVEKLLEAALIHLKFTIELCLIQHEAGRLFLFEHPASASSWSTTMIKTLAEIEGVFHVKFDFCMLGMVSRDADGTEHAAKKRTGILTNSGAVATLLRQAQCRGEHWHMELLNGRAGPCQVYPEKFTRLICEGIKKELENMRWKREMCEIFDISTKFGQLMAMQEKVENLVVPPEEDPFEYMYQDCEFHDDVHDRPLDRAMAIKARRTEIEYFKEMGVYTKVRREPWMHVISTKWIDTNKGDELHPNYRARLVGRELNLGKRDGLFAATPPLESLRMILSVCASNQSSMQEENNFLIMSNDIKRAYFYAPVSRPMFIAVPGEDWEDGDENMVGQLNLSLYGTRDAAVNWSRTFTAHLASIGFEIGKASPCNFYHPEHGISLTVHGDDFTSTGREADLRWLDLQLRAKYEIKTDFLGPGPSHSKQLRILNRVISWDNETGITYEPDQRHTEIIIKAMDVQKAVSTPGSRDDAMKADYPNVATTTVGFEDTSRAVRHGDDLHHMHVEALEATAPLKLEGNDEEDQSPLLDKKDASTYRALAARANYLALDRPDI